MITHVKRLTLILIGLLSIVLGALGIFVPLLPTTPFLLLAAFAFANSSERMHQWLLDHNIFGPLIDDWRQYRAISRRAKIVSILSMVAIILISALMSAPTYVVVIQALVLSATATFVLSRPLPPR